MAWREARKASVAGKGAKAPIKGSRWALSKNASDLAAGQKAQLEYIAATNETLWNAYKLKEELRMILRQPADEARVLLLRWSGKAASSGIGPFTGLGEKIGRRCEDIVRTIRSGLSNARLEAVNNRIKTTIGSATATATSTTSSPSSCSNAAASTSNSPDANNQ